MKRTAACSLLVSLYLLAFSVSAYAHCQIPCGIYDDSLRITLMAEHISTIEKSMQSINDLALKDGENSNQIIRWVMNKEEHVEQLHGIITAYFMTQRLTTTTKGYSELLSLLHQMLVASMKAKQSTDRAHIITLRNLLAEFDTLYFKKE